MTAIKDPLEDTMSMMALAMMEKPPTLIVEDDVGMQQWFVEVVQRAGFEAIVTASAEEAFKQQQTRFCPIAIVDKNLPAASGIALVKALRVRTWPSYQYIIVCTFEDSDEDMRAGLEAGADDYVSKSISAPHLAARLEAAVRVLSREHSLQTVVDQKRAEAITDALTGMHNRRYFKKTLERQVTEAADRGAPLSMLLMDIDRFKAVNDTHGHTIGDEVLRAVGALIKQCLSRPADWCARIGGEEFAMVLPNTDLSGAVALAERLRAMLEQASIQTAAGVLTVTTSIGVSALDPLMPSMDVLYRCADKRLYASKHGGRNRVTFNEETL